MKYNNPENTSLSTGRFNGNIAEIDWRTSTVANDNKRRYSFTYDRFNRLQQGIYSEPGSSVVNNNNYNEQLTYDLNGNILTLKRFSKPYSGTTPELIDDLVYNYTGNRLDKITLPSGTVNNASGYNALQNTITYNANGSMVNQLDKNINTIEYNHLNLPRLFSRGSSRLRQTITYTYRADGVKVGKNVAGGFLFSTTTDYLDGFQYQVSLVGDGQDSSNFLQFFPTSEGYFDFQQNKYIYNYTDHLGNVRLSYFNNGSGTEVLEENNYYPFGLKHGGYNQLAGNTAYQYKYNGKELQTETGMYDYGARFYMPDIGRWGVVDPLAEKMRRWSSYNYAFDNPIRYIDPDGRAPFGDFFGTSGKYLGSDGIKDGKIYISQGNKSNFLTASKQEIAGGIKTLGAISTALKLTNSPSGHIISSDSKGGLHEVRADIDLAGNKTSFTTGGKVTISGGMANGEVNGFDVINQHGIKNKVKSDIVLHTHPTGTIVESAGREGQFTSYTFTSTEPSGADKTDFAKRDTNIIAGNIERNTVQVNADGTFSDPNNKQGAVFYDKSGNQTMTIEISTINKILSNYENGQIKP